ncbi:MAG: lamin tail domain-containing protein [Phycisphaerae bacterium]|nr:lamin tail domain-containing protein [Phycisphaerae bacterium]
MRKVFCLMMAAALVGGAYAQVVINEVDYQNPSTDTSEWIEIAGAAGTDLTGWQIVLVNQTNTVYATHALSGIIPNDFTSEWGGNGGFFVVGQYDAALAGQFGAPDYTPSTWGNDAIQNGPDDLIQLYDATGTLVDEWQYDSDTPGAVSFSGNSQDIAGYDSAGTFGDWTSYSSLGRIGYSYDLPFFVFDLPHGFGSVANDMMDHQTNSADFWASTPRGPITEAEGAEIAWSGTYGYNPASGLTPGTFNKASYAGGAQDAYTINIVPEPTSLLLLALGFGLIRRR